jgi:DNA-binding transcriptional regulator YiaG
MSKRPRTLSFRRQMKQSMAELRSIIDRRESPTGDGRFSIRALTVAQPSQHGAASVRAIRKSLTVSQTVFAQLLGVSPALVRAWELGTRVPAPIARRLLDQVRRNPSAFATLLGAHSPTKRARVSPRRPLNRGKRVA